MSNNCNSKDSAVSNRPKAPSTPDHSGERCGARSCAWPGGLEGSGRLRAFGHGWIGVYSVSTFGIRIYARNLTCFGVASATGDYKEPAPLFCHSRAIRHIQHDHQQQESHGGCSVRNLGPFLDVERIRPGQYAQGCGDKGGKDRERVEQGFNTE